VFERTVSFPGKQGDRGGHARIPGGTIDFRQGRRVKSTPEVNIKLLGRSSSFRGIMAKVSKTIDGH